VITLAFVDVFCGFSTFSTLVAGYENQAPFWVHGATQMKPLVRKLVGIVNGEVFWRRVKQKPQPYPVFNG